MKRLNLFLAFLSLFIDLNDSYRIGLGRADVTGPSVEIAFVSLSKLRRTSIMLFVIRWATHNSINAAMAFTPDSTLAPSSSRIRRHIE